jgi:hypothetical protein
MQDHKNGVARNLVRHENVWTDWFLQTVREERVEKTQLLETFGETYLFAFGQKPRTLVFQGTLMNTQDFNWRATFWENWENEFRASQLIKHEARMYVSWDDILVEGYPINAVTHQVADSPNAMVFSFTFFVTNYVSLAKRNDWEGARRQVVPLSSFRKRVPNVDNELVGSTTGQDIVNLTGLRGVRTLAGLARNAALDGGSSSVAADLRALAVNTSGSIAYNTLARVTGAEQLQNLLAYETARFTRDAAETILYGAAASKGFSVADVNMWFGYAAVLVSQASEQVPSTVDALLQKMGYMVQDSLAAKPAAVETTASPAPSGPKVA